MPLLFVLLSLISILTDSIALNIAYLSLSSLTHLTLTGAVRSAFFSPCESHLSLNLKFEVSEEKAAQRMRKFILISEDSTLL